VIHTSPFPDVEIPDTSLVSFVLRHAARLADKPALIEGPSGRTLTYGEFANAVQSFAGGLAARGFGKGDVLAIMAPNIPEYAVVFHGTAWAGGTVTTINPTYSAGEVRHQLDDSGATLLVTVGAFVETAALAAQGTQVTDIFTMDASEGRAISELMGTPMTEPIETGPDDVVCMPYSSGTTGLSKGVMLTHRNLVANLLQTEPVVPVREGEVVLTFLPFFHIYGMQVLMNATLASGGTVVTMPRFDLEQFLSLAERYRINRAFVVPPVVLALTRHPSVDNFDLSHLTSVFSGAAPLGEELAIEAGQRLGAQIIQGYGMTELSPVSHAVPMGEYKPGSVGFLVPSTEARIVDPDSGEDVEIGEDGEIWIRGPQVMAGYLNNPEATATTIDSDGWLHTGDLGHVSADRHFTIVDRLKELIKVKGFQVPPAELEALLVTHEGIADAAVIGIPDDEAGELPKAFITLKPGHEADEQGIKDFVAQQVASYKRLRFVEFVDKIPKSASGKILRRVLRGRPV
jgi:4-coumarate--CoA ligase